MTLLAIAAWPGACGGNRSSGPDARGTGGQAAGGAGAREAAADVPGTGGAPASDAAPAGTGGGGSDGSARDSGGGDLGSGDGRGGSDAGQAGACPPDPPGAGSACSGVVGPCSWGTAPRLECRTTGSCNGGAWSIGAPQAYCTAPAPAGCPATAGSGTCTDKSLSCFYPPSRLCSCVPCTCNPGPPGPPCALCNGQPLGTPVWFCDSAPAPGPAPCPAFIPNQGSPCDQENLACPRFACNQTIAVCRDGLWRWMSSLIGCPVCASPETPIATPDGDRRISDLRVGDLVYTAADDAIVPVPVASVGRTRVANHHVVRVKVADGRTLEISAGHPTADGRTFGDLRAGTRLDGVAVESAQLVPYGHQYTYDILPASKSGTYFAAGLLIGSTLKRGEEPGR